MEKEQLSQIEMEMKIAMSIAYNESKKFGLPYNQGMNDILAKAAAALCERKATKFAEWLSAQIESNYKSGGNWYVKGKIVTTPQLFDEFQKFIEVNKLKI